MTKKEIEVKWEDFSLFDDVKKPLKLYNSVLVVDLKGKKIYTKLASTETYY